MVMVFLSEFARYRLGSVSVRSETTFSGLIFFNTGFLGVCVRACSVAGGGWLAPN